jgi:superfamily II DNA or RNA helicase
MPGAIDYADLLAGFESTIFRALRPAQAAVLAAYASDYAEKSDVGVELPTGAGKSPIALLVCEAWRREGKRVAILTANKTLAGLMQDYAEQLGVSVARLEGRGEEIPSTLVRQVSRHRTIGVMNYWVYFN